MRSCRPTIVVLSLLALAAAAPAARAQFAGFQWELKGSPSGSGTVAPDHLHVVGPDDPSACIGGDAATWFEAIAPMAGHVSAIVQYITLDDWPSYKLFDAPVWVLDGKVFIPWSDQGWSDGTYTFNFDVLPHQAFGLGVSATDCCCGPGIADVVELVFTPAAWTAVGAPIDPQVGPQLGGASLGAAGDVNGDGYADVVVGLPADGGASGAVRVCSGTDGAVLIEETGDGSLGAAVAGAGDLDADGVPDFIGGAPLMPPLDAGAMFAWSGATGAELFDWPGGAALKSVGGVLAGLGDTDADGFDDVALTTSGITASLGRVTVLGGPDGHEIQHFASGLSQDGFGASIAGVGDVDLDGLPDVLVGAPAVLSSFLKGTVYVYSSGTGELVLSVHGDKKQFGQAVAPAGDLDQDGRADLLVADPHYKPDGVDIGRAAVYSGLDGTLLQQVTGAPGSALVATVSGGADVSGDGLPDIATALLHPSTALRVYSGADGGLLHEFAVPYPTDEDIQVAVVGNIDAEGTADAGIATSVGTFLVKALDGLGSPHLSGTGEIAGSLPVTLLVDHGRPGAPALLVLGSAGLSLPLLGGVLVPSPDVLVPFAIDLGGGAQLQGHWPPGLPAGTSVWFQAWIEDPTGPAGWTCTNGLIAGQIGS